MAAESSQPSKVPGAKPGILFSFLPFELLSLYYTRFVEIVKSTTLILARGAAFGIYPKSPPVEDLSWKTC